MAIDPDDEVEPRVQGDGRVGVAEDLEAVVGGCAVSRGIVLGGGLGIVASGGSGGIGV